MSNCTEYSIYIYHHFVTVRYWQSSYQISMHLRSTLKRVSRPRPKLKSLDCKLNTKAESTRVFRLTMIKTKTISNKQTKTNFPYFLFGTLLDEKNHDQNRTVKLFTEIIGVDVDKLLKLLYHDDITL